MSGQIYTARDLTRDVDRTCDVAIIGSGAGGGMLAEGLRDRGLDVVVLEEGSYVHPREFDLREDTMTPRLYQDRGTRATADLSIAILQGRAVGGTTVINWTTCYRTPERILRHWADRFGAEGLDAASLAPHFDAVEQRLGISSWPESIANANNRALFDGCRALGWHVEALRRNVRGCANSGYCGVGCPVDGKQSMLVTCLPAAVEAGLDLYADTRAVTLEHRGDRVTAVHAEVLDPRDGRPTGARVTLRPQVTVVSGGAINSPALLLRSGLPEGGVGRRTMLHPVVALPSRYPRRIEGWAGAPQSAASHQHVDRGDAVGYFIECPPMQPMLASTAFASFGAAKQARLADLPYVATLIAVCVDGLAPGDEGGTVSLRSDGRIRVDYPVRPALAEAFRHAHRSMAQIALAAGAVEGTSLHRHEILVRSDADLAALDAAPYGAHEHPIFTAHQMGGCALGADPSSSVVRSDLRHHRIANLYVVDGSVLPTGLGVNPSETIYALAHRARATIAQSG